MLLSEAKGNSIIHISRIDGDRRVQSRLTSVGLAVGSEAEVIQNSKKMPVLLYVRDTMLAVSQREAAFVKVEEVKK